MTRRRLLILGAALAALFVLALPAGADHDPIHAACKANRVAIHAAIHGTGTAKQRLNAVEALFHNSQGVLCDSEPVPPLPPPPPVPPPPPEPPPPPPVPPPTEAQFWSADSPFNIPLTGLENIDPNSAAMIARLVADPPSGSQYQIVWKDYGVATYEVTDPATPRYTVRYTAQGLDLPGVPIPANVQPANGSDAHLTIIDHIPGSPTEGCTFDMLHPGQVSGFFDYGNPRAEYVQRIKLHTETGFVHGASTRGSSAGNLGGILTPQDFQQATINHALFFYVPNARHEGGASGDPRAPSWTSDGVSSGTQFIPEGARVRLNPSYDASGLPVWQQKIAQALKTYGAFIGDKGGRDIAAIDNTNSGYGSPYPWGTTTYPQLPASLTSALQVIELGPLNAETYNPIALHPCGDFQ